MLRFSALIGLLCKYKESLIIKMSSYTVSNTLFTVWNWVVSDIVDCNSMFYVTKPVFKHPPPAVMLFFAHISTLLFAWQNRSYQEGCFLNSWSCLYIMIMFELKRVFELRVQKNFNIAKFAPHWTIPIWSDNSKCSVFGSNCGQLFAAILLLSANQSPHFPGRRFVVWQNFIVVF